MIIFTDNENSCKKHFGSNLKLISTDIHIKYKFVEFTKRIFNTNEVKSYSCEEDIGWDYGLLAKNAPESQFDIINTLISENIELPDKIFCLAEQGSGFHGFRNRFWMAAKGNIHLSLYFKPQNTCRNFHTGLLIVAAVAVLKTIDSVPKLNERAKTKWVNDIIIDNSKVCGIITQSFSSGSRITGAVIGLGLNVLTNPNIDGDIFTPETSSLLSHSNINDCNLQVILKNLLKNLADGITLLNNGDYNSLLEIYIKRSAVLGKEVSIYSDKMNGEVLNIINGKVIDINDNLELIIENHTAPIKSGRLSIIKP